MAGPDKTLTEAEAVAELRSGMSIGIGGWGSRRKPMSVVREILRSDLTDLTVVAYGGPDVGLLCRAGKVAKVISGFVSLDSIPLEPNYRLAGQNVTVEAAEWDEGMLLLGLQAAAWRVPFLPTRAGLGSDIPVVMPDLRTVRSPYPEPESGEHEEMVAVPALDLDAAFVHQHRADSSGNAMWLGEDPFMDDLFVRAAKRSFVSCEQVVDTGELASLADITHLRISRLDVAGVIEAPGGAHFTECPPDYSRDEAFQKLYAKSARDDDDWAAFSTDYLEIDEAGYRAKVAEFTAENAPAQGSKGE
ncbi:MAG: CoA transferase subunit A [Microthrixaceae bacterium]